MKFLFGLTIIILVSCDNKTTKEQDTFVVSNLSESDSIPTLDTTIILSNLTASNYNSMNLTNNLAKTILYKHFKNKGYLLPDMVTAADTNSAKECIQYDTAYFIDLNNNKYSDAIITYWLTPPFSSGHCWQPHKAIIIDTDKEYKIINEEFIPDNFAIDSVVNKNGHLTTFCYDYDCGNNKILKNLRIKIK